MKGSLDLWSIRGGDGSMAAPEEAMRYVVDLHDMAHVHWTAIDPFLRSDLAYRCRALGVSLADLARWTHTDEAVVRNWLADREERARALRDDHI